MFPEYIYWSDVGLSLISRSPLATPEHSEIVINDGLGAADGIAIDEYERKLYWTGWLDPLLNNCKLELRRLKVTIGFLRRSKEADRSIGT